MICQLPKISIVSRVRHVTKIKIYHYSFSVLLCHIFAQRDFNGVVMVFLARHAPTAGQVTSPPSHLKNQSFHHLFPHFICQYAFFSAFSTHFLTARVFKAIFQKRKFYISDTI